MGCVFVENVVLIETISILLVPKHAQTARNPIDSSTTIRIRQTSDIVLGSHEDVEWKDVFHFPYGEEGGLLDFFPDNGKTAYLTSSLGRETTALLKVDTGTGETLEELYSNDKCNVGGVTLDKETKELRALTYNYARTVSGALANTKLVLPSNEIVSNLVCQLSSHRNEYSSTTNLNEITPFSKRMPPNPIVKLAWQVDHSMRRDGWCRTFDRMDHRRMSCMISQHGMLCRSLFRIQSC